MFILETVTMVASHGHSLAVGVLVSQPGHIDNTGYILRRLPATDDLPSGKLTYLWNITIFKRGNSL